MADYTGNRLLCRKTVLLAAVAIFISVSPVFAVKVSNVTDTPHNLSSSQVVGMFGSDVSEVCVFCHTPHNSNPNVPLWNHYSTTKVFSVYSSATLESGVYNPIGLPDDSMSRLCLACHEGTVALNSLINPGQEGVPTMPVGAESFDSFFGAAAAGIGVYLSDDLTSMHPIGFDYADSQAGDSEIMDISVPKAAGLQFFGTSGSLMECSTCHDPHLDGDWYAGNPDVGNSPGDQNYKLFLRMSNSSSALCLTCHNK